MQYLVQHLTRFVYTSPVSESVMELRMQPLERGHQRCLRFQVTTSQRARIFAYRDHYGNAVHYFDVPGHHSRLDVSVESIVDISPAPDLPRGQGHDTWRDIDALSNDAGFLDWLLPSAFTTATPALAQFVRAIGLDRSRDPLTTLRTLNTTIHQQFAYEPRTTRVDSPLDEALRLRAGVCQDFSHILATIVRGLGVPCRYVSGYLAPHESQHDRAGENATHAWVEAYLPSLGWIGFDPTNNTIAGPRHIVVAVGSDYHEVPPTRGVFKGGAGSELSVAVSVRPNQSPMAAHELAPSVNWVMPPRTAVAADDEGQQQQQQ